MSIVSGLKSLLRRFTMPAYHFFRPDQIPANRRRIGPPPQPAPEPTRAPAPPAPPYTPTVVNVTVGWMRQGTTDWITGAGIYQRATIYNKGSSTVMVLVQGCYIYLQGQPKSAGKVSWKGSGGLTAGRALALAPGKHVAVDFSSPSANSPGYWTTEIDLSASGKSVSSQAVVRLVTQPKQQE